jgi:hypothetical protein
MWTSAHIRQSPEAADVLPYSSQRRPRKRSPLAALVIAGLLPMMSTDAVAGPCSDVTGAVYVAVPPAAEPYVEKIAQLLQLDDAKPVPVIWQVTTSCRAAEAVALDNTPTGSCAVGACLKGSAKVWPLDRSPVKTCELDRNGTHINLALSEVFPGSCKEVAKIPAPGILDIPGPISPYTLVMAPQAMEGAMHAEEAHFVFGAGKAAGVKPWLNDAAVFLLGEGDAGALLLSPRIKLPIGKWRTGRQVSSADDVVAGLATDTSAGLGILPTAIVDKRRGEVRVLGFQSIGQHGAFFPDRKSTSFDKQNVRDGHYPLWGYLHMILRADPGVPSKPLSGSAGRVANILTGREPVASRDTVPMQLSAGFVPQCAMRVSKASDSAPLTPLSPPSDSCSCWFEKNVTGGLLNCAECKGGAACTVGTCRREFCEAN